MSDDNELNPEIEALLRDVPIADPSLREQHIAAALAEMKTPVASTGRLRFLAAAAAVVVLIGGGITVAKNSGNTPPAIAADTTVTSVPKASGDCGDEFSGLWGDSAGRGEFTWAEADYTAIGHQGGLSVYLAMEPCTTMGEISYWDAMVQRDKEEVKLPAVACTQEPISHFIDNSGGEKYKLALVRTDNGVSLFFEDRCNEPLGSLTLPTSGD